MDGNKVKLLALERLFAEEGTLPNYLFEIYQKLLKQATEARMYTEAPDVKDEKMCIKAPDVKDEAMYKGMKNEDLHSLSERVPR